MKAILKWTLMLPLIASISMIGCKKNDADNPGPIAPPSSPVAGKTLLWSGVDLKAEVRVEVYTDVALYVGYNRVYVLLFKSGTLELIKDAHVSFQPVMTMNGGMTHSCPIENPNTATPADGIYRGAVVFIMPSGASIGTWKFGVQVHNHLNNQEAILGANVDVMSHAESRLYSFINPIDSTSIFVTRIEPMIPIVGLNDFEVAIYWQENMESFPAVEDYVVEIDPQMPTHGHGSPDNVNPVHMGMGHYLGTANFTMPGYWRVNMTIKNAGGIVLDDQNGFDITF